MLAKQSFGNVLNNGPIHNITVIIIIALNKEANFLKQVKQIFKHKNNVKLLKYLAFCTYTFKYTTSRQTPSTRETTKK